MHYWRCGVQRIYDFHDLSEILLFLNEIFFRSKTLPTSCEKYQKFDCEYSSYPAKEAQVLIWPFLDDFVLFLTMSSPF